MRFAHILRVAACATAVCLAASSASAQARIYRETPRLGSYEVGGGAEWTGGFDLGERSATETRNIGTGTGPFELFTASSRVKPTPGVQGRVGFYLSRDVALEAGVRYLRPMLSTRLSADAEDATSLTASETMTRYVIDGSLVMHLNGLKFAGGRGVPFLIGGAGYVRELHERNELIETGREYHGGAGLKYWFSSQPSRLGLRLEAGASIRDGAFDFSDGRRTVPTAGASLIYLF